MKNRSLIALIEGTILAALAIVLSFVPTKVGTFSISLGMIPVTLYAIRRGPVKGMFAGLLWGVLHILVGRVEFLTFWQGIIEYFFAYTFVGLAGFLSPAITKSIHKGYGKRTNMWIVLAVLLGTVGRYIWHYIAGVIFWGQYAPEGMSPELYSLSVNGLNGLLTAVVTVAIFIFLRVTSEQIFVPKRVSYK